MKNVLSQLLRRHVQRRQDLAGGLVRREMIGRRVRVARARGRAGGPSHAASR